MCSLEVEILSEDDSLPMPLSTQIKGGHPMLQQGSSPSASTSSCTDSGTETEIKYLMEGLVPDYKIPVDSGVSKEQICPVCEIVVVSGLALIRHFHEDHPDSRSYFCKKCEKSFHTIVDLRSHVSTVHKPQSVYCKFCNYTTTTHARMRKHVRIHTKGEKCNVCDKSYLTLHTLMLH